MFERMMLRVHRLFGYDGAINESVFADRFNDEEDEVSSLDSLEMGEDGASTVKEGQSEAQIIYDNEVTTQENDAGAGRESESIFEFDMNTSNTEDIINYNAEKSDLYAGKLLDIGKNHRLIICNNKIQCILQKKKGSYNGRPAWRGVSFYTSKENIYGIIRRAVGDVSPEIEAKLSELPGWSKS